MSQELHEAEIPDQLSSDMILHTTDQRVIHVAFCHNGVHASKGRQRMYKKIFGQLWKRIGPVEKVYYPPEFRYCLLQFRTHASAVAAITGLNDPAYVLAAMGSVLIQQKEEDKVVVRTMFAQMMPDQESLPVASWGAMWNIPATNARILQTIIR